MNPAPEPPALDLSKIRHELRTPINHILGYCDILLEEDSVPGAFRADLLKIHNGGRQLLSLINHYFDEKTFLTMKRDLHTLFHELRTPVNHIIGYSELLEEQASEAGCAHFAPDLHKINLAAQTWLSLMEEHLLPAPAAGGMEGGIQLDPGIGFVTPVPRSASAPVQQTGALLVVDDDPANREMLGRRLQKEGYTVTLAENGLQGIKLLRGRSFDLVLLDLIMPGLDGYQVLARLKGDPQLKHVPVIMISALDQENGIARCIEMGAEDYIAKPFTPVFLRARIGASLEKKRLRDQERKTFEALLESQRQLAADLAEASQYVQSLLPEKLTGPVRADWIFQPSSQLGGDIFGYHWLDEDHFVACLLDVCGHGVGAALLSVSVMNVLRGESLPGVEFRRPAEVLAGLNRMFRMENQNNLYFTIFYAVYRRSTRELRFASGGHPPALLCQGGSVTHLRTRGPAIGCLDEAAFAEDSETLAPGARLVILSDGVYEITGERGNTWDFTAFAELASPLLLAGSFTPAGALAEVRRHGRDGILEDDFSLMLLEFA